MKGALQCGLIPLSGRVQLTTSYTAEVVFTGVFSRPARALIGSALTIGGSGLVAIPFGAIVGVPLLIVGNTLCVWGTLVPVNDELSKARRTVAEVVVTLGAVVLFVGCIMASSIMVEYLVALKRGQIPLFAWDLWATILASVLASTLLTVGNLMRARTPTDESAMRAIYWFLHCPGAAVAVKFYAALGVVLTA